MAYFMFAIFARKYGAPFYSTLARVILSISFVWTLINPVAALLYSITHLGTNVYPVQLIIFELIPAVALLVSLVLVLLRVNKKTVTISFLIYLIVCFLESFWVYKYLYTAIYVTVYSNYISILAFLLATWFIKGAANASLSEQK